MLTLVCRPEFIQTKIKLLHVYHIHLTMQWYFASKYVYKGKKLKKNIQLHYFIMKKSILAKIIMIAKYDDDKDVSL